MSPAETQNTRPASPPSSNVTAPRRTLRVLAGTLLAALLLLLIALGGFSWYSTTPNFQRRVTHEVVQVLEDATGGRVELQRLSFSLWRLEIEADGLVIHGTEPAGEAPYLSADKILIQVKILSFLSHSAGGGAGIAHRPEPAARRAAARPSDYR
jgi:translocation and assembly module TamB